MKKIIAALFFICVLGVGWFAWALSAPTRPGVSVAVTVAEGSSAHDIAVLLYDKRLIRNKFAFELYLRLIHARPLLQAGEYQLSTGYNVAKIVDALVAPNADTIPTVTLIEGWTLKEYRTRLVALGFDGNVFDDLTSSVAAWQSAYPFLADLKPATSLEGYAFPDTYAITSDRSGKDLVGKMLANFQRKVTPLREAMQKQNTTLRDEVIMASIIEREVMDITDRKIVADIFWRRLDANIALQSDATINYITGSGRSRSTAQDLKIKSPYNTYLNRGLPPGPIGNPGFDAIDAAVHPTPNSYWYFLTDEKGIVHYAKTYPEHQQNIKKYLQ